MSLQTTKKMRSEQGFTIVELLIVIVVIGILAAITIVAYNGVQNRAHKSAAQSAASVLMQKAEAANSLNGVYPTTVAEFTNATNQEAMLAGSGITLVATLSASSGDKSLQYIPCSTSGAKISYWDPVASAPVTQNIGVLGTCTSALTGGPY